LINEDELQIEQDLEKKKEAFNKMTALPAQVLEDMTKLRLRNVKIIIAEWVPSGPNYINIIAEEMGAFQGQEWMRLTHQENIDSTSSQIDESKIEKELLKKVAKTDFFHIQTDRKNTPAKNGMDYKAEIRTINCNPTDSVEFKSHISSRREGVVKKENVNASGEKGVVQKENVNVYVDRNGLIVYSAHLKRAKVGELEAKEWIPVFMLTRIIPDLIEDTTPLSECLLGKYQKDMLGSIFGDLKERNKYVMIVADKVEAPKAPDEQKELCRKDGYELLNDKSAKNAILELVEMVPHDNGVFEIGENGCGRFMIDGTRGSILVDPEFESYNDSLKLPLACKALSLFLKSSYIKIWTLWDEISKTGKEVFAEYAEAGHINLSEATRDQETLTNYKSDVAKVNNVINYSIMSCENMKKQIKKLEKDKQPESAPEYDVSQKIFDHFSSEDTIDTLKSRASVQKNIISNLADETSGKLDVLSTMIDNETSRQTKKAANIAIILAVGAIVVGLFGMNIFNFTTMSVDTMELSGMIVVIVAFTAVMLVVWQRYRTLQARRKIKHKSRETEGKFKPVL
jgi:hypothetical protein